MIIKNNDLKEIKTHLRNIKSIKKIILFGSYANQTNNNDSDIDLCILIDDNKIKETDWSVRNILFGIVNTPIDLLIYNELDFKERSDSNTSFENQILKNGVFLYG